MFFDVSVGRVSNAEGTRASMPDPHPNCPGCTTTRETHWAFVQCAGPRKARGRTARP